ncbi:Putative aromatic amino acid lyase, L-Aspartase, phenylalanine/histidine ammonia-lyase, active [Septoria linicola]|uniref:Aromatic amino acid lyase, L-Aspartase, phenylalanine/histidine ammonia-lyase, active n=1 Tax=Septoria linicola TaxID=215465 RepID=A0A9Q9AKW4_9PEZI|nr:putative aromatic amino acid lyase, L-Aspartase, phenylalanine/histidine ammonia-lyase, active [Septoria linicola]USW47937.1 Putative aromatic amino acid lyase, L-Aspartase, phenylalanine/histidine ammonia-lyase, active [Septoria linicola]
MHGKICTPLTSLLCDTHNRVQQLKANGEVKISGHSLDVASVVAVARHNVIPRVEEVNGVLSLAKSVKILKKSYDQGDTLYGINTGFGGSADVRSQNPSALQKSLLQTLQSAVITFEDRTGSTELSGGLSSHALPLPWTRAMMAVRCNSCIRGHSAISRGAVDAVLNLLEQGITPVVPLRGSISASGDLMPLAYVAGAIEGSPDIFVRVEERKKISVERADQALSARGLAPISLSPRDALALVNGTSASAAVGGLVFAEAGQLSVLSACITGLISEAMAARVEWSHPFLTDIRPHPGQYEASHITRTFLQGSELVSGHHDSIPKAGKLVERFDGSLAQDRYPLRTSPQWLGPQFEDLLSAHAQIAVELNSTSDNPSTDPKGGQVYCGGNFQAAAITSAVEKIRLGLQMVGKMLFSQTTEMLNHHMSGLPANLAADDPSQSFCLKGLDINMAAYQSELAFLANPVSNHVQSAEMHNQAINSLALLSARYTSQAVELVALLSASALYAACQAVDLRVMHATFLEKVTMQIMDICTAALPAHINQANYKDVVTSAGKAMRKTWWDHGAMDFGQRSEKAAWVFVLHISGLDLASRSKAHLDVPIAQLEKLQAKIKTELLSSWTVHRTGFLESPNTSKYLGTGTARLYKFVRDHLSVPIHHGLEDHPSCASTKHGLSEKKTIGSHVSIIYEAIRDGRLFGELTDVVDDLGLLGLPN